MVRVEAEQARQVDSAVSACFFRRCFGSPYVLWKHLQRRIRRCPDLSRNGSGGLQADEHQKPEHQTDNQTDGIAARPGVKLRFRAQHVIDAIDILTVP